jgi:hydroxyacylglutathione hydrolase
MGLIVDVFEARSDNYGYLAHDSATGKTAAIDAPEAEAIEAALQRRGWTLSDIFITHHHLDHVEAIPALKDAFGATVTGPRAEAEQIAGLDRLVGGGDVVALGETTFRIFDTPGHTLGHIAYYDAAGGHLFTADALFSLGVGRMFEGTPGPMWEGLKALRDLPDETLIYCGHEYTAANARFALSVDPDNATLRARAAEVDALRIAGRFTIPVSLKLEKATNPFLRADSPEMARAMGLPGDDAAAVFGALRKAKDNF